MALTGLLYQRWSVRVTPLWTSVRGRRLGSGMCLVVAELFLFEVGECGKSARRRVHGQKTKHLLQNAAARGARAFLLPAVWLRTQIESDMKLGGDAAKAFRKDDCVRASRRKSGRGSQQLWQTDAR